MFSIARKSSGDYLVSFDYDLEKEFEVSHLIESLCKEMGEISSHCKSSDTVMIYRADKSNIQSIEKMLDNYLKYYLMRKTEEMARRRQAVGHDLKVALLKKESVDFDDLEDYLALCD